MEKISESVPQTKEEFSDLFWKTFSRTDLLKILYLLRDTDGFRKKQNDPDVVSLFRNFPVQKLSGYMHRLIHGKYCRAAYYVARDFATFKQSLRNIKYPWIACMFPEAGVTVNHNSLGQVKVTKHAWKRFCRRFEMKFPDLTSKADDKEAFFLKALRLCFNGAKPTTLTRRNAWGKRLIKHGSFVRYLYDQISNLRFVVSMDGSPTLFTVEIPNYR